MSGRKVLIGGGSGFIGSALGETLKRKGFEVLNISRSAGSGKITWSEIKERGIPSDVHAVVSLSGANIMEKKWTEERKKELLDSRITPTKILADAISNSKEPPKTFVTTSAVGIYPSDPSLTFDETYPALEKPAENFAIEICQQWEKAGELPNNISSKVRTVCVRSGFVLGDGGALAQMIPPFKFGLGGPLGSGQQWFRWITLRDIAGIFAHAVENDVNGVLNGVSPGIVTNEEFSKGLGQVLHRPVFLSVPKFALNMIFQERAFLVTEGSKILPKRTIESGYQFKDTNIVDALKWAVEKGKPTDLEKTIVTKLKETNCKIKFIFL
eukprot:TRINITY_DN2040_c0_g1_i6.p1 TRINITY_DN2040_c0_g1~~TRINITY_DN2040_c0_g1_i6.p1  ORF type:complete len:326 (-),score=72.69 TRINITY_DN2040_c0_g1_i6:52-1029(-)